MNNDIDYNELEKESLKSIKEIAATYSLSTNKLKKKEIIEKIKVIAKRKREYKEEQEQKENVNSFNKLIKLTITEGIEPTELLFWKLFRNKSIYKKIFSFMDNRFSVGYDSISSIPEMIQLNQFGMLKEKVNRNCRFLHFPCTLSYENLYSKPESFFLKKLFENIKDDYQFYRNYFKNDNAYHSSPNNISLALILSKNLEIYQLYINEFNYKPTKTDLKTSIIIGSNKFISYLLQLNPLPSYHTTLLTNDFYDFKYQQAAFEIYSFKNNHLFYGLLCYFDFINSVNSSSRDTKHELKIDTLIEIITLEDHEEIGINEKSTLKELISICKLISKLNESNIDESTTDLTTESFESVLTLKDIENFTNKIDKVRLKSTLDNPINFENQTINKNINNTNCKISDDSEIKEFIKELLILYCSTVNDSRLTILSLCYFDIDADTQYFSTYYDFLHEGAFRFGDFNFFSFYQTKCERKIFYTSLLPKNDRCQSVINDKILFSNCLDRDKKIKFIDQIIENNHKLAECNGITYFFYMLVVYNDLELIQYYENKISNRYQLQFNNNTLVSQLMPPTYYIDSIEVLDYLFENHIDYFNDVTFPQFYSTFFKRLELLKHFESLIQSKPSYTSTGETNNIKLPISFIIGRGFRGLSYVNILYKLNKNYLDFAIHFGSSPFYSGDTLDGGQLFSVLTSREMSKPVNFETLKKWGSIPIYSPTILSLTNGISEIGIHNILYRVSHGFTGTMIPKSFLKFIDWMFTNYNNEIKEDKFINFGNLYYHLLIATDRYNFDSNSDNNNNNNNNINHRKYYDEGYDEPNALRLNSLLGIVSTFTPYLFEVNNFKFLHWFLTKIKNYHYSSTTTKLQKSNIKIVIYQLLEQIVYHSKLNALEFIYENYNFILKKESIGGILRTQELKLFLFTSLKRDIIKISEFFFRFIDITSNEFEKHANHKSKLYFSNKFKY
ncbi:hypothetical protein RB653_009828 [Dictyostelium firmibasis]|uniref:Rho termination factor N-terminal domain-containing protein n=1 Tax=Dictyostelium firmibasis TaxID=79012 RepID=A0AAN7TY62_9MYCE